MGRGQGVPAPRPLVPMGNTFKRRRVGELLSMCFATMRHVINRNPTYSNPLHDENMHL